MRFEIEEKYRLFFFHDLTSEVIKALSELANLLVKNQTEIIDQHLLDETSINLDLDFKDILKIEKKTISFTNKEYFVLAYSEYLCQNDIIDTPLDPENTIKTIQEADWNISRIINEHVLMEEVFICLSNQHGENIILFVDSLINSRKDFWDIYPKFCYALKILVFSVEDLINFLKRTSEFRNGDMMSGYIANTFAYLAKHKPKFAKEIRSQFLEEGSVDLVFLLGSTFVEFSKSDFSSEYEKLFQFTFSDQIDMIRFGIQTLGRLDYNEKNEFLSKTENRLKELIVKKDPLIAVGCCRSIYFLIGNKRFQTGEILLIADINTPEIQAEISWILNAHKSEVYTQDWSSKLLKMMAFVNPEFDQITSNLDQHLSFLLNHEPHLVEEFLTKWINSHEESGFDIPNVFSSTLIELKNRIDFLQSLLTKYLNSDDFRFHLVVGFITSSFFETEEKKGNIYLELDEEIVKSFDLRDSKFVLFKILGFVFDSHQKCSLVFSMLKNNSVKEIKDLVINSFIEVILYEYPVRKDYLNSKKVNGNKVEKEVAEKIITRFTEYEKALDRLEDLKELKPSRHKIRSQQIIERERRKEIHEGARKSSVLLDVVKNITTKYGRGWTYYHEGKIQPPSYMASISTSVPIPRTLYINPTEAQFQSYHWRTISREDVL